MKLTQPGNDGIETILSQRRSLSTDSLGIGEEETVEAHFGGPSPRIPRSGAHVHPLAPLAVLIGRVVVVIFRRHLGQNETIPHSSDDEDGAVFPARGILLVGHPRPAHLAWVGVAVGMRVIGEGRQARRQVEYTRVRRLSRPVAPATRTGPLACAGVSRLLACRLIELVFECLRGAAPGQSEEGPSDLGPG